MKAEMETMQIRLEQLQKERIRSNLVISWLNTDTNIEDLRQSMGNMLLIRTGYTSKDKVGI